MVVYVTHTITPDRTRLVVGEWLDNEDVIAMLPDQSTARVPRFLIETPVLCCAKCGRAVLDKKDPKTGKPYAVCPDHSRHMYETMYAAANDTKTYSRADRHRFRREAGRWLARWIDEHDSRIGQKAKKD